MGNDDYSIVSISKWDIFTIQFFSIWIGTWILCKRIFKWLLRPNTLYSITRDNPPPCLVDSSLGQHKYVKLQGTKFHYVDSGPRDQPVILLLHGFPDCWLSWRYQIPALSTHFRVIALDLKGFGDTEKPMWHRSYRIETLLRELKQLISVLGIQRCAIIGHDLGALLGWFLAHDSPDLITKFIAISCSHPNIYWNSLTSHSLVNSNWVSFIQLPYLPETEALNNDLKIISDIHKHLQQKDTKAKDEFLEAYKYSFSRKEDWIGPINYYRTLPFVRIAYGSQQIRVSTLLIHGEKDTSLSLESVVRSTEYCEKFSLKVCPNASHFPHQENPDLCNKEILKFLKASNVIEKIDKSKGIMDRMFGAVSSTVKYGNSMLDTVQKKTINGVTSTMPTIGLSLAQESALVKD